MEYNEKEMQEYIARFKMIMNRGEIRSKLLYASSDNNTPFQNYILQKEAFKKELEEREKKIKEKERMKQEKEKMVKDIAEEVAAEIEKELKKALNG